jgi:hypothetical protein
VRAKKKSRSHEGRSERSLRIISHKRAKYIDESGEGRTRSALGHHHSRLGAIPMETGNRLASLIMIGSSIIPQVRL